MAVRHINPNSKIQSGVIVSGKDALKVFSLFDESKRTQDYIATKKRKFKSRLKASIKVS
jgi:hypothetical protein